jgi:phenylalanyl-tRNA synthetase beta subunit
LITSGDKPIAIAGVMGGEETEVSEKTVNMLSKFKDFPDPFYYYKDKVYKL